MPLLLYFFFWYLGNYYYNITNKLALNAPRGVWDACLFVCRLLISPPRVAPRSISLGPSARSPSRVSHFVSAHSASRSRIRALCLSAWRRTRRESDPGREGNENTSVSSSRRPAALPDSR